MPEHSFYLIINDDLIQSPNFYLDNGIVILVLDDFGIEVETALQESDIEWLWDYSRKRQEVLN